MGQRLGIATALLGDPSTLVLDEPVNGLDPEGIRWIRDLLRSLASEGRTVFVSSHLMSEMALTAEHLVVIGRGRLIADTSVADFIAGASRNVVRVRTTDATALRAVLLGPDVTIRATDDGGLEVEGLTTDQVGIAAGKSGITLLELTAQQASLEEAFMGMTSDAVEYHASTGTGAHA
jgi:ABC-2 type transport system ATP-binding protein